MDERSDLADSPGNNIQLEAINKKLQEHGHQHLEDNNMAESVT